MFWMNRLSVWTADGTRGGCSQCLDLAIKQGYVQGLCHRFSGLAKANVKYETAEKPAEVIRSPWETTCTWSKGCFDWGYVVLHVLKFRNVYDHDESGNSFVCTYIGPAWGRTLCHKDWWHNNKRCRIKEAVQALGISIFYAINDISKTPLDESPCWQHGFRFCHILLLSRTQYIHYLVTLRASRLGVVQNLDISYKLLWCSLEFSHAFRHF